MVRELFDRNSKLIFHYYPQGSLKFIDFPFTFSQKLSNELISNDLKKVVLDYPMLTEEGPIVDIEPHNRYISYYDEENFNVYQSLLHQQYHRPVFLSAISPKYSKSHVLFHKINGWDWFTMYIKSLIEENQLKTLNSFKNKINIDDELDKVKFLFLPWMNEKNKKSILKETIYLTLNMDLNEYDTKAFLHIQLNSAEEWFDDETLSKIKGDIMKSGLSLKTVHFLNEAALEKERLEGIEEGRLEGRLEGIEEGRLEEKIDLAQKLLRNGFSPSEITKFTGLSINQVYSLMNSK